MGKLRILMMMSLLALVIAACSGDDDTVATLEAAISNDDITAAVTAEPQAEAEADAGNDTVEVAPADAVVEEPEVEAPAPEIAQVERPDWHNTTLVDARTGESFTLADFAGQTVFVEPMATWCTNCRSQLGRVAQARFDLDPEQHVFIALSLEPGLSNDTLANYADGLGFDWTFAVIPPDLLSALSDEFGRAIRSAPNTPHFVIRPDGSFTSLSTGSKSVDQIVEEMRRESEV